MINHFVYQVLPPYKLIFTMFTEPVSFEDYKAAMLQVYTIIKEQNLENWLMDSTKSTFRLEDQRWSVEHLGLLLQDTGLKKVAMVRDNDAMLQIAAESMRTKIYRIFGTEKELKHFGTTKEALQFILSEKDAEEALRSIEAVIH
ncbi:MAG: hypothetical protein LPJ89_04655 [Hymenobacteraceae bacterium]|nr:hypothetical protein [Hymenobacteraceae bacterium]